MAISRQVRVQNTNLSWANLMPNKELLLACLHYAPLHYSQALHEHLAKVRFLDAELQDTLMELDRQQTTQSSHAGKAAGTLVWLMQHAWRFVLCSRAILDVRLFKTLGALSACPSKSITSVLSNTS